MPDTADLVYLAFFALALTAFEHFVGWPRMRRLVESGVPDARLRIYRIVIPVQWLVTIGALLMLRPHHATARTLWIVAPTGRGLALALVFLAAVLWLLVLQYRGLARLDGEKLELVRNRLGGLSLILPRDRRELLWFMLLAVTAGVCEELLYRGYALWVLQHWAGFWGAAAISTILFGLGHGYQGRGGAIRAGILGAVFVLMLVVTRSLLPAIVIHALVDVGGGLAGWAAFRERGVAAA